MQKINRKTAGVQFESDVLAFFDQLAHDQQRTRSFIINSMGRWYAKWLKEQQQQKVDAASSVPVIRLD